MKNTTSNVRSIRTLLITSVGILTAAAAQAATCAIDGNTSYQTIDGFGFSSAWCGTLPSAKNSALYGTLGMSLLRVRIDENNAWSDETANATAARNAGVVVLGCPWRWPSSMSSATTVPYTLKTASYSTYSTWLASACTSIGLNYVSIKNEPDMASSVDGNLTGAQIHDILAVGTTIGKPIALADAVGFSDSYSDPALNDTATVGRVTVVSGHLYGNGNYVHQNAINKGKKVWMTEHYITSIQTSISQCMIEAKEINDCMNNRMNAYIWWWVYDNTTAGLLLANNSGTIYKGGYILGQFAKYVRPGKVRISSTYNPNTSIYVTAYRSGGLVIVAVNTGTSSVSQTFSIANVSGVTTLNVNRTSSSENMASVSSVSASSGSFTYTLPAQSVTTFHQY